MGAEPFERALRVFCSASSIFFNNNILKRVGRRRMAARCLALFPHACAVALMVTTEPSLVGMAAFLLVWIMLNCLWLA